MNAKSIVSTAVRVSTVWMALCACIALPSLNANASDEGSFGFVTRQGDQLYENGKVFRFISFNAPTLHINEDPEWHRTTAYEQEDCIKTIRQMGGGVVRIYVLSVAGGDRQGAAGPSHVCAPGIYNETLFQDMDRMLALLNKYKVRVIIPFVDQWTYYGGKKQFAHLYGKTNFYDPVVVQGFKELIKYVVTRTNTLTGVPYREDPAILAWETGNELSGEPGGWLHEVATYIKSVDTNHLVADGNCSVREDNLAEPAVDLVTDHIYGVKDPAAFVARIKADRARARGRKPFYLGEFDPRPVEKLLRPAFEEIIAGGSTGALVWSLRFHKETGGFYDHLNYDDLYFHYPYDQCTLLTKEYAYKIQGRAVPAIEILDPPFLLPIPTASSPIGWQGSAGANAYVIEKASSEKGPWTAISTMADQVPQLAFKDSASTASSYYRVKAKNGTAESKYSNLRKVGL